MKDLARISLLGSCLTALLVGAARGQTPLIGDQVVAAFLPNVQAEYSPQPVCDDAGVCDLFWVDNHNFPENKFDVLAAVLSPQGQLLVQPKVLATVDFPTGPIAVGLERGFAVVWEDLFPDGQVIPMLQYYDESLVQQGESIKLPFILGAAGFDNPSSYNGFSQIARIPQGFALFGAAIADPSLVSSVFVFFIGRDGTMLRPRQRLNDDTSQELGGSSVQPLAVLPGGTLVAAYTHFNSEVQQDIYMRRLAADGTPLGPEELVSTEENVIQGVPVVASGPDGAFPIVWQRAPAPETTSHILARRFAADGQPLGEPFQVNNVNQLDQRYPVIAADAQGNYFIAWQSFYPTSPLYTWEIKGRLFRPDGTPVTGEIRLNLERQFDQTLPRVVFSPNGTVVAGWESESLRQRRRGNAEDLVPVARTFAASPGQEICAVVGGRISCDLARTGGDAELQLLWGGRPGEVTLFGDWDGDGRDDVCGYFQGRFRCDVNHAGRATVFDKLGQAGDVPLLADVDGDGRADPCLWRAGRLLCDTTHDGKVDYEHTFRLPFGGVALLGDLDADHRADLCVVKDGEWNCQTQAGQELHFTFGQAGDSFSLGDAARDGRAEPCLLRDGLLLCTTKHDGGPPDYTLALNVPAGARLLFGNLDGL